MAPEPSKLTLLYDGLCPICAWEVRTLAARDRKGQLAFEDIANPAFDPARYGLTIDQAVGAMHAVDEDGVMLRGVDAFVEAYRLVGLGWLARVLTFRPTRPLVNLAYRIFARFRPRISKFDPATCVQGRCRLKDAVE